MAGIVIAFGPPAAIVEPAPSACRAHGCSVTGPSQPVVRTVAEGEEPGSLAMATNAMLAAAVSTPTIDALSTASPPPRQEPSCGQQEDETAHAQLYGVTGVAARAARVSGEGDRAAR